MYLRLELTRGSDLAGDRLHPHPPSVVIDSIKTLGTMTAANAHDAAAIPEGGIATVKLSVISSCDVKSTTGIVDQSLPEQLPPKTPTSSTVSSADTNGSGSSCTDDDDDDAADEAEYNGFDEDDEGDARQHNYHDKSLHQYFTKSHTQQMDKLAQDENKQLNLNLGLPIDLTVFTRRASSEDDNVTAVVTSSTDSISIGVITRVLLRPPIQVIIHLFDRILALIESPLFQLWDNYIPLYIRQKLTFLAWGIYLPLHKLFIGRRSGLHRDVSLECHALTSVLWWGRLVREVEGRTFFCFRQRTLNFHSSHFVNNGCKSFVSFP